jgi:biotin operon repressor
MMSPKRQKQLLLAKSARMYLAGISWRQKARLLGSQAASQLRVRTARQMRNPWEEWEIRMIGRYSDQELARRIGRGYFSVMRKRRALGIPPFMPHQKWDPREIQFLTDHPGEFTDAELSRKLGRSRHSVGNKRKELGLPPKRRPLQWTRKTLALLGQLSDCELARRLNISRNTIGRKRMELNIPPSQTGRHLTKKEELAIQLGKSRTAVR